MTWEVTLGFDVLSDAIARDIETLAGFYAAQGGAARPFLVPVPAELGQGATLACRFADDQIDQDTFAATLVAVRMLALRSVKL